MSDPQPTPEPKNTVTLTASGGRVGPGPGLSADARMAILGVVYGLGGGITGLSLAALYLLLHPDPAGGVVGALFDLAFIVAPATLGGMAGGAFVAVRFLQGLNLAASIGLCLLMTGTAMGVDYAVQQHLVAQDRASIARSHAASLQQICDPTKLPPVADSGTVIRINKSQQLIAYRYSGGGGNSRAYCHDLKITFGAGSSYPGFTVPLSLLAPGDQIAITYTSHITVLEPGDADSADRIMAANITLQHGVCPFDTTLPPPDRSIFEAVPLGGIKAIAATVGKLKTPLYGYYYNASDPSPYGLVCNNTKLTDAQGRPAPISAFIAGEPVTVVIDRGLIESMTLTR